MKILNEKGKLFGLINIIDLGVLLLIVAVIAGALVYMSGKNGEEEIVEKDYVVSIKCSAYPENVANNLKVGHRFYYGKAFVNAVVKEVSYEAAQIEVITETGDILYKTHPLLKDIYLKVTVHDDDTDPMINMGHLHATIGKEIPVKTRYVEILGTITDIQE